jgi:long-chain acyl-CoA synthetase
MYKNKKKNYPLYEVRKIETLRQLFTDTTDRFAEKKAFIYREKGVEKSVTFKEFRRQVDSVGTVLCKMDLKKAHIAIIGENSYGWILSYWTVLNTAGVVVPIDKDLTAEDTEYILETGDVAAIFYASSVADKIETIAEKLGITVLIRTDDLKEIPEGKLFIKDIVEEGGKLLDSGDRSYIDINHDDIDGLKQIMFTSGTTGKSKGVMHSSRVLLTNAYQGQRLLKLTERSLSVLPYHHAYEATAELIIIFHAGLSIMINESLRTLLPNLKKQKPTEMLIVPLYAESFYRRIWDKIDEGGKRKTVETGIKISRALLKIGIDIRKTLFKEIHETFGGELKLLICGGAPLKPAICEFFNDIGISLAIGYGITECGPLVSVNRPEYFDCSSVGLPLPETQVKIDNPNENGEGEICVKGDNVMMGYYKNKAETDKVIVDGWFHTGDIGKIDDRGIVFITGRCKNMIVLENGENVYPEAVEESLTDNPIIKEVVVSEALRPDGKACLGAEVFPNMDYAAANGITDVEAEVRKCIDAFNDVQPPYKTIKQLTIRDTEFEKTTSKKIKRKYHTINK